MIDERSVAWDRVADAEYRIEQTLRYEYDRPISDLRHQLIIAPRRRHLGQARVDHRLWSSADVPLTQSLDAFGNDVASLALPHVEREIAFNLESTLVRSRPRGPLVERFDRRWLDVGRLTRVDEALEEAADMLRARNPNPRDRADAIMHFVNRGIAYTKGVTDVFTTASVAFRMGRGVCQDYAHIAIALARATGIGARYASGHMIGEGATHAWVEFLLPHADGSVVYSLDPTHHRATDFRYVVVAIGRDYDDVPPTSGVFRGRSNGTLSGRQILTLVRVAYAA